MNAETINVITYFLGYIFGSAIAMYFSALWLIRKINKDNNEKI